METNLSENQKNLAALIHVSTFSKFFFPFGNFIVPLLLWTSNKEKPFVESHGRKALNFQLSMLLYSIALGLFCLPFTLIFITDFVSYVETLEAHRQMINFNDLSQFSGFIILLFVVICMLFTLFIFELYAIISATLKANKGLDYNYPLSIPFIKVSEFELTETLNQSKQ